MPHTATSTDMCHKSEVGHFRPRVWPGVKQGVAPLHRSTRRQCSYCQCLPYGVGLRLILRSHALLGHEPAPSGLGMDCRYSYLG